MKLLIRHSDKVVGVFFLVGTLFLVGALTFVGVNKRWFQRDLEYLSYFDTANGLSTGLALEYRGFAIGRVKSLHLGDGDQVQVVFSVFHEYADRIVEGSVVELAVQPLGFGSNLFFYPGTGGGPSLPPGSTIVSTDLPLGRQLVIEGKVDRPQRRDEVATLIASLPPLLGQVEGLVRNLDKVLVHVDQELMGGTAEPGDGLLATVDATVQEFGDLARRFETLSLGLDPMLESLTALAQQLEDPHGLIPTLMGNEGSAAQFFQDNAQLYQGLLSTMAELQEMMIFLKGTTPDLSILLDETTSMLVESEQVLQGLKNNPLLRGGIPPRTEHSGNFGGYRQEDK
jgi:phospholipid/cholesterol/gamma-HCH transport system substrate-binding protein|nr:MlaD family protein [Candidatus Krumholzibacteria bacterium]